MKSMIMLSLLVLSSVSHALEVRCISKEEAVAAAVSNVEKIRVDIHAASNLWTPRPRILEFVKGLEFSASEDKYVSSIITRWTCAPGSDCYVGVTVDCGAQVELYQFAD